MMQVYVGLAYKDIEGNGQTFFFTLQLHQLGINILNILLELITVDFQAEILRIRAPTSLPLHVEVRLKALAVA